METGTWPVKQRIQYATLMLCHNIQNSDEKKIKIIEEQEKKNNSNTFSKKLQQIAETLETETATVTAKKKSTWKKEGKEKVISKVKKE